MYIEVNNSNKDLLDSFISMNLPPTFRYFSKRKSDVIQNHLITLLLIEETPIGYAHIDFEDNKYWFGICILDKGKGYGTKMMNTIFNHEKIKQVKKVYLTVDKINTIAIHLYSKFNFKIIEEKDTYFTMLKIIE